ncbi:Cobalamin synthesis protein cobW C-terminal domain-containing protein [Cyclobacterium lianum]|uniref:Cobalamin synthesis protein cobW C-terminal domain-containing protein n=2 Tax=Cyclobacterium lianum TaxID=388280 RepID=A0A1M7JSI6_9BACT|nr:Cobalamin synthesis protein cobW C-terminal domain-containing protein [Cyclobacterium lianum]
MNELVIIGQDLDRETITKELHACLVQDHDTRHFSLSKQLNDELPLYGVKKIPPKLFKLKGRLALIFGYFRSKLLSNINNRSDLNHCCSVSYRIPSLLLVISMN